MGLSEANCGPMGARSVLIEATATVASLQVLEEQIVEQDFFEGSTLVKLPDLGN